MRTVKRKRVFFSFIAVILVVVFCFTAKLPERTYAAELLAADVGTSVLQKQSLFSGIIRKIFSMNPIGITSYGIKGLLSLVLGKDPTAGEISQILSELDEVKTTQNEMMQSLKSLETMVECEQLDSIINSFNALKDEWAPRIVYDSLITAENIEDPVQCKAEEKSYLLGGLGIDATSPLLNSATVPFDTYVEEFGKAISGPYKVTFTGENGISNEQGNIFWIYQQYKRRDPNSKWEHMATEDMAKFYVDVMGNYMIAAMIELQSLNARIEAIAEYNNAHTPEQRIGDQTIRDRFDMLMNQMGQIADIAEQWEVEQHDEYRYLWVPGHELRIYPEAITKQQPEDPYNAMNSGPKQVGYNMEYAESMIDYNTPNQDFWAPLFRYNDSSSLINYDQVNKILDAYGGTKSLYSILKDEAGITFPDELSENNAFMLNPQPGHEMIYRDHKDEAGYGSTVKQLVCYICPGNATNVNSTQELILQEVSHWKSKFLFITTDKQGQVLNRHCGVNYSGIGFYEGGYGNYIEPYLFSNTSTIESENSKKSVISASWKNIAPETLDVTLCGNGEKIMDCRLTAAENWTKEIEWEEAVDEQGNPYPVTYSLEVKTPAGYTQSVTGDLDSGFLVTLNAEKISLAKAKVTVNNQTYTGKALKPAPTVKLGSVTLKNGTDYTVKYSANTNAGTATVTITGKGNYNGTAKGTFKIAKAANPLKVKTAKKTYTQKKLTKAVSFKIGATKGQGKLTYAPDSRAKKAGIKVTAKGLVKIPKKCKKGTYKLTVKAAGNENYKAGKKTVNIRVK